MMNAVILACSSLAVAVTAAQKKMKTDFPVGYVDRKYHASPLDMRLQLMNALEHVDDGTDTVLVAMGFCGGSWENIKTDKRIVIPYADDCVTISLHTDDTPCSDMKQRGHFYFKEPDRGNLTLESMEERLCRSKGEEEGKETFQRWFQGIDHIDIVDTELYDSYEPRHLAQVQRDAELTGCSVNHVPGSNHLLEKLVSGRWDGQFLIVEPGKTLTGKDFE